MPSGTYAFPLSANVLSSAHLLRMKADTASFGLIGTHQFPNIRLGAFGDRSCATMRYLGAFIQRHIVFTDTLTEPKRSLLGGYAPVDRLRQCEHQRQQPC